MDLQSNAQHQQSVPPFSVHDVPIEPASGFRNPPDRAHALYLGTPQRRSTVPNDTFPRTPVSPNSRSFFATSQTSAKHAPSFDMKVQQNTLGRLPITPVSPVYSFSIESATHDCEYGHQFTEPTHLSPSRVDLCNGYPISSQDRLNCVHELTSRWKGDPAGTLPTPVSAVPKGTVSQVTPIQAIDLTSWIRRSYGLDPVAGGAFGNVWKCTYDDGLQSIPVAVKGFRFKVNEQTWKKLRREMGIWRRLNHPNVMEFMGIASGFGLTIALVAPWAENGTLTDHLEKRWPTITTIEQLSMLDDIASGLSYLHFYPNNPIIHGDLTGSNVLILQNMTACIADFGLSSMLGELQAGATYLAATAMHPGAVRWVAPELLDSDDLQPTTLSDVYSLGSIMLQVLSGKVPWHEIKREVIIIREIHQGHTPSCPPQSFLMDTFWPFIQRCWSLSPDERPTAGNALEFIRRLRASLHPSPVDSHDTLAPTVTIQCPASNSGPLQRPRLKIIT